MLLSATDRMQSSYKCGKLRNVQFNDQLAEWSSFRDCYIILAMLPSVSELRTMIASQANQFTIACGKIAKSYIAD